MAGVRVFGWITSVVIRCVAPETNAKCVNHLEVLYERSAKLNNNKVKIINTYMVVGGLFSHIYFA